MRRKEREVTEHQEILSILSRCDTVRISMKGDPYPYAVPVSFGFEVIDGKTMLYFHCARQGMKLDLLQKDPRVCVEGDIFFGVEKTAHGITTRYESVIGFGECRFLTDKDEIIRGMKVLAAHYGWGNYPLEQCRGLEHLLVGRVELSELYGKRNLPEPMPEADRAGLKG